jgi:hypothetical protein
MVLSRYSAHLSNLAYESQGDFLFKAQHVHWPIYTLAGVERVEACEMVVCER